MPIVKKKISLYQSHVNKWSNCTRCELSEGRRKVVLVRGQLPCDVLFVGEAPGECISGDTLIETAYRDKSKYPSGIPVKDLVGKKGVKVYSYDLQNRKIAIGDVKRVWVTGVKKTYKVSFYWWGAPPDGKGGRKKYYGSITVTDNHPFLLKTGEYRSIKQGLTIGNKLQPFYRHKGKYDFVGCHSGSMKKESILLMEHKLNRSLESNEQVHHDDRNKKNDTFSNLILLDIAEHARLHGLEDNAMFNQVHKQTHKRVMESDTYRNGMSKKMKEVLSNPEVRAKRIAQIMSQRKVTSETVKNKFATDPSYYYNYLKGRVLRNGARLSEERIREKFKERFPTSVFPEDENHEIISIEESGFEKVYDMEVEKYHNFAANGIFVHNSEDVIGTPFVGPAGKLLDHIIKQGIDGHTVRYALTNLVGCFPKEQKDTKNHAPPDAAIKACSPRLDEVYRMARPSLVVCVGSLSAKWVRKLMGWTPNEMIDLVHPAAILRADVVSQEAEINRSIVKLNTAIQNLLPF